MPCSCGAPPGPELRSSQRCSDPRPLPAEPVGAKPHSPPPSGLAEDLQVFSRQPAPLCVRDGRAERPDVVDAAPSQASRRRAKRVVPSEVPTCMTVPPAKGNPDVTPRDKRIPPLCFGGTKAWGSKEPGKEGLGSQVPSSPAGKWAFNPCFPRVSLARLFQVGPDLPADTQPEGDRCGVFESLPPSRGVISLGQVS